MDAADKDAPPEQKFTWKKNDLIKIVAIQSEVN